MFSDAISFNGDISGWDTSNVDMEGMIDGATNFNRDLQSWNVTNMCFMFAGADSYIT